jgi:tetratricopeptide (TPR) repeat protein
MPRQFQPTDSRNFFVGRKHELKSVIQLLQNGQGKWLIQILGEAGIGKTRFLEQLRDKLLRSKLSREWYCADIVDFYKASNQTTFGLLTEIARKVGIQQFGQFESQRQIYEDTIKRQPDKSLQQEAFHRVANAFFADWRELLRKGRRFVLLFDTCEEMHLLSNWINRTLLPNLWQIQKDLQLPDNASSASSRQPQIVALFAGQKALALPQELEDFLLSLRLPPLRHEEAVEFFRQAGWFPQKIRDKKQLAELNKRCDGRPLFIALSYEWLMNQIGTIEDLLETSRPFSEKLVEWILQLRDQQSSAILAAALAWRRMEAGLLAKLMAITATKAAQLFEDLKRYSFVKYRPPDAEQNFAGSFQLHDAMREIVNRHLWPREGPWTQRALLKDIVVWYEERIGNSKVLSGEELPPNDEMRALLAEYLYYRLSQNAIEGSRLGETLFKTASYYLDISLGELLNHEISRFEKELLDDRLDQLRFQQALMAFRRDDYALASDLWYPLTRIPDGDKKLQATTHMLLVELESYRAKYHEAEEHAQAAEGAYRQLLKAVEYGSGLFFLINKELGQLYNNWGYIFRAKSLWEEAGQYYQKALTFYQKISETESQKNVARTLNNIGFVYFQQNDVVQALTYVGRALQIRQQLHIPYELGLGHNTLGMIKERQGNYEEAANLFQKAKHYFEVSHSDRGLALVYINLGRLRRMTCDFDQALEALNRACRVLEEKNDVTYLIIALNEIGCAYRQRGGPQDHPLAEDFLQRSLTLSQGIGDRKAEADNFEDLGLLYYYWGKALKAAKAFDEADRYFEKVRDMTQRAFAIAEREDLPFLRAKVERISGDVDFEKPDYDRAFDHLFRSCEVLASAMRQTQAAPIQYQYQRRLTENADRLQERLLALPDPVRTRFYAGSLLQRLQALPEDLQMTLGLVATKLQATLQLGKFLVPTL